MDTFAYVKKLVAPGTSTENIFADDEKWELRKLPGYVACSSGKGTDFTGHLKGTLFSYECVDGGSAMDGRIYYLQVDSRTFYVLHFTVASKRLQGLRAVRIRTLCVVNTGLLFFGRTTPTTRLSTE